MAKTKTKTPPPRVVCPACGAIDDERHAKLSLDGGAVLRVTICQRCGTLHSAIPKAPRCAS